LMHRATNQSLLEPPDLSLLYLHLLTAAHLTSNEAKENSLFTQKQKVVIVGAGMSGLTAAQVLHKGAS
jgi:monoamine oxidase